MRRILGAVLAAHYLAAFTALGMPVFMPSVLAELAPAAPDWLAGTLYVLPTICTALTASAWGRLADRYGRRLSLMRAQLGLAIGFLLAGCAPNLPVFVLALIIQGTCGGSLAAANAYLSTQARGPALARALDWTQFSARLAMLSAPVLLGLAIDRGPAQSLYAWLAFLPLLGLLVSCSLPADAPAPAVAVAEHTANEIPRGMLTGGLGALLAVQFLYYFAVVVTFPYFIAYARGLGVTRDSVAGLLYGLPHLVYLLMLPWRRAMPSTPRRRLLLGLLLLCSTALLQALLTQPGLLTPLRVLGGIGMTLAISGLNHALSEAAARMPAGRLFGRFDACGKWAGAAGGIAAGLLIHRYDLAAPFVASAAAGAMALTMALAVFHSRRQRASYVPAGDT